MLPLRYPLVEQRPVKVRNRLNLIGPRGLVRALATISLVLIKVSLIRLVVTLLRIKWY